MVLGGGPRQRARRGVDVRSTPPEQLDCVTWGDAEVGQGRVGREVQKYPLKDEGGAVWLEERRQGVQQMVERGDLKIEGGDDGYPQSGGMYEDGVQGGGGDLYLPWHDRWSAGWLGTRLKRRRRSGGRRWAPRAAECIQLKVSWRWRMGGRRMRWRGRRSGWRAVHGGRRGWCQGWKGRGRRREGGLVRNGAR